jgi:hypothetical protein
VIIGSMVKVMPGSHDGGLRVVVVGICRSVWNCSPMPWPMKARTTPKPGASAWSSMARPMSETGRPGRTASMPFHMHSSGDPTSSAALGVDVADEEGGVGVAVDAVEVDGHVEVHDVAVTHHPVVGDAVADDLVDRGAQRLREAVVVERAGVAPPLDAQLVHVDVDLVGGHAGLDPLAGQPEDLGGHRTRPPHARQDLGRLDPGLRLAGDQAGVGVGGAGDGGRHGAHGAHGTRQHASLERLVAALVLAATAAPAEVVRLKRSGGAHGPPRLRLAARRAHCRTP